MKKITLIHAVDIAIEPIKKAFQELWPEAQLVHLWDQSLSIERAKSKQITPALYRRIADLTEMAMQTGTDAIMFTCSAFGEAIEQVASQTSTPVLKPNEAMFKKALSMKTPITMIGSFAPAMEGMESEFYLEAQSQGVTTELTCVCVPESRIALSRGDIDTHNQLVVQAIKALSTESIYMLAHFSSSYAKTELEKATGKPVLSSPHCAVLHLKNLLEG
ncbi:aspartate/glutamate racemase family protein [Vibrio algivorus]|uniref:Arylsulfatase n=1 Tax=Vibrio algivorus TaxID=1667024 RepID=A0ABQ6EKV7_9VIBR|nr:arylsulfatase [Vibrio algivorus]GLT13747.1 arylsulfatase [Vibrio algivorus]